MALSLLGGLLAAPMGAGMSAALLPAEAGLAAGPFEGLLCAAQAGAGAAAAPERLAASVDGQPDGPAFAALSLEGVLSAARSGAAAEPLPAPGQAPARAAPEPELLASPTGTAAAAPRVVAAAPAGLAKKLPELLAALDSSAESCCEPVPGAVCLNDVDALPQTTASDATEAPASILPPASPEPFLHWLETLKALSARLPPGAAQEPGLALPTGSSREALMPAMVEVLADSARPEAAAPMAATGSPNPAPAFLLAAAPLTAPSAPALPAASDAPLAMDQADWPEALGEQIQWRLGVGIQEARIEISPRELGAVDVRLSMDDNGLKLHLSAAHAETRELLQAELPRLREALQNGGLLLADAQVGQQAPGREPRRQPAAGAGAEADEATAAQAADAVTAGVWRQRRGLLDDYA